MAQDFATGGRLWQPKRGSQGDGTALLIEFLDAIEPKRSVCSQKVVTLGEAPTRMHRHHESPRVHQRRRLLGLTLIHPQEPPQMEPGRLRVLM